MEYFKSMEIMSRFMRLQIQNRKTLPIRSSEMGALILISQHTEGILPIEISHFFGISKPSVSDMIKVLVNAGYVEKIKSETDKRSYHLVVTQSGATLIKQMEAEYLTMIKTLENQMGEEDFEQFMILLQQANTILSEVFK